MQTLAQNKVNSNFSSPEIFIIIFFLFTTLTWKIYSKIETLELPLLNTTRKLDRNQVTLDKTTRDDKNCTKRVN